MFDFVKIDDSKFIKDKRVISPKFIIKVPPKDIMIRGGQVYGIWNEESKLWVTEEDAIDFLVRSVDKSLKECAKKHEALGGVVCVNYMWDSDSKSIDRFWKYVQRQMPPNCFSLLDDKVIFENQETCREDFASKKLPYPLKEGDFSSYDELIGTLYSVEERRKLEWAIGAIVSGDSRHIQKFEVLYGEAGSGKSTFLNIVQMLFQGYCNTFDAKELGSANNAFALESFKSNPLVSIQHDGDLSRIEDNTKLNSLVSHEVMEINAKFEKKYAARFHSFLFMGTNKPVKITDAKSGLLRRLIDVKPSGKRVPRKRYKELMNKIKFELGAIASHCLKVYQELGENYYDNYMPKDMMAATNDFYDFVEYNYDHYKEEDMVTLAEAWKSYDEYCEFANAYKLSYRLFRTELRNYFKSFEDRLTVDGKRLRSVFVGFRTEKFENMKTEKKEDNSDISWLTFNAKTSSFDEMFSEWPAQYEKDYGNGDQPEKAWSKVKTKLKDIDTKKCHYVNPPKDFPIVMVDFDLKGEDGEKNLKLNLEAASKFPKTYAELSKSGKGLHLYYIWEGCPLEELSSMFAPNIEVKVFHKEGSAIRRLLTKCNSLAIAVLSSGLPKKGVKKVVNWEGIQNEKMLRTMIKKNLNKEYHSDTSSSINYINSLLDEAYESGMKYDVSDMQQDILLFAMNSTNQKDRCVSVVGNMKFMSEEAGSGGDEKPKDDRIVFFDVEVYPNLFIVVWKYQGAPTCVKMINPKPHEVEELFRYKLVGFNNRKYDNHILYARSMGYSNEKLFDLSQKMITERTGFIREAYNLSYTDVYDFCSKKQSLKKWEIELGIHHQEMGIPWDQPAPEDKWVEIANYCENDVKATEAVFEARKGDFLAREILADIAGGCPNDTTNTLTTKFIFGTDRNPQLVYTDLKTGKMDPEPDERLNVINEFPEYEYVEGWEKGNKYAKRNMYRGEDVGFGGYVYSEPGMYGRTVVYDVRSMHPNSARNMSYYGKYEKRFDALLDGRVALKAGDMKKAKEIFGSISPSAVKYIEDPETHKALAQALKIAINSCYGLTAANFDNPMRDKRNKNNIVALRGALFMVTLRDEIQAQGFKVISIKTDSIKVIDPDEKIEKFIFDFGKRYGYDFEIENIFEKICLVNDSTFIAKCAQDDPESPGKWIPKAAQFQDSFVFKSLFSKEKIIFEDYCRTFSVSQGAIYIDDNEKLEDVTEFEKRLDYLEKKLKKGEMPKGFERLSDVGKEMKELEEKIRAGHNLKFIGRVGQFVPVKEGTGGGVLYRVQDGKNYALSGTKGYRWLEAETIKQYGWENKVNLDYFRALVDEAKSDISKYGDFEWFVSDKPLDFINVPEGINMEVPYK